MYAAAHCQIRNAEIDDARALARLYRPGRARAFYLDRRREPHPMTADELREVLLRKDRSIPPLFVVETRDGVFRGACSLRDGGADLGFGEVVVQFDDDADYETPMGGEVMAFLCRRAFEQQRMHKVMAHRLESETRFRALLDKSGFSSNGVQREVVWTLGRWHDLEALTLSRQQWLAQAGGAA